MQNKNSKDYKERGIFMIKVELKDGSIIEVEEGKNILDVEILHFPTFCSFLHQKF